MGLEGRDRWCLLRNLCEDATAFVRDLKPELAKAIFAHNLNYRSMCTSNRLAQVGYFEPDQVQPYRLTQVNMKEISRHRGSNLPVP